MGATRSAGFAVVIAVLVGMPATAAPTPDGTGAQRRLVVAVAESPPFAFKEPDGSWSGLSVDLWHEVADRLNRDYELREVPREQIDTLLSDGTVDLAIGAIAVEAEGERQHDFSQPYNSSGLGFAEHRRGEVSALAMLRTLESPEFLRLIGLIAVATVLVGVIIAFIERRREASEFGGPLRRGIATGVWWAAVTMTTVGYGDATPKTTPGRSVALLWMFVGVVAVALFTATVTSLLTVGSLHGTVQRPDDLMALRLGVVSGGPGAHYLTRRHVSFTPYPTYDVALDALAADQIDAVVANMPTLRHVISRNWQGVLRVSHVRLEPLTYAIGLPPGSALREPIDQAILDILEQDRWREVEQRYLGH